MLVRLPAGGTVRAYDWMELSPIDERPIEQVGALLATLHRIAEPTTEPRDQWFVAPVGEPAWTILLHDLEWADAPFAADVAALLAT